MLFNCRFKAVLYDFQTADDARKLLKHFDPKLGEPLAEKSYGGSCIIYDTSVPDNPWHNVLDKFDVFVPTHLFGKTFICYYNIDTF